MKINFSRFDVYTKITEDERVRTRYGAIVSIICGIMMTWLFLSEFSYYLSPDLKPTLFVDNVRGEKMTIFFDITFHQMPCSYVSLDIMDHSEEHVEDHKQIYKVRLDMDGKMISVREEEEMERVDLSGFDPEYCGSCYGAEETTDQCCNTCDDVRKAYLLKGWNVASIQKFEQCEREKYSEKLLQVKNEGCKIHGFMRVNKINGNFHIAPGQAFKANNQHVHDLELYKFASGFNMSHTIDRLGFGTYFPGIVNPLDGTKQFWYDAGAPMYQYFLKVVPTQYIYSNGKEISTNQYSATDYVRHLHESAAAATPGVFFNFDFSPIRVTYHQSSHSFAHFLTNVCAIIGGVFTIASLIDSVFFYWLKMK